ncbi:MAG: lipoyl domain-containing protein [Desulfurococcales archaeon]|nr:lipoyl domain-containing protein [Desulfurococcales archaeon]
MEEQAEYTIRVPGELWPSRRDWTAIVVGIYKDVGDKVAQGELVAELELEKAIVEVESPVPGTVLKVHAGKGDRVRPGDPLLTLRRAVDGGLEG